MRLAWSTRFAWILLTVLLHLSARAQVLLYIDFRSPYEVSRWQPIHSISRLLPTLDGMQIEISGEDPYTIGPAYNLPSNKAPYLRVHVKAEVGTFWQIFYFRDGTWATEEQSVRFSVPQGQWGEATLLLPILAGKHRFRIDPPGPSGRAWVRYMSIEVCHILQEPQWLQPTPLTCRAKCGRCAPVTLCSCTVHLLRATSSCWWQVSAWQPASLVR